MIFAAARFCSRGIYAGLNIPLNLRPLYPLIRVCRTGIFVPLLIPPVFRPHVLQREDDVKPPAYGNRRLRHTLHPGNDTGRPESPCTAGPDAMVSDK